MSFTLSYARLLGLCGFLLLGQTAFAADGDAFFESKIRPLLVENCHKCHGPKKQQSHLRLDSRASALAGGDSGPAVVPGKPDESLLVEAINYKGPKMPPDGQLSAEKIALLTAWIKIGAPWPGSDDTVAQKVRKSAEITDADRAYWAFQPIRAHQVPTTKLQAQPAHAIDAFVLARLEAKGLAPNGLAEKRELIRRAYFDIVGLPPSPEAVEAFCSDNDPKAYEKLLDQLLASPQYGERWGRHWLDVVRFAQTNGYERDDEKPFAWRYRDYVINAFNEDKPYDRFVLEQLAGDELDDVTDDSIIATGFQRLCVWDDEPDDKVVANYEELDDNLRATGAAFLGLTIGCARCHDHKFDPLLQKDYYSLLAFFRNVAPYGKDKQATHFEHNPDAILTPLADGESKALSVRENSSQVPATHVLIRGNPRNQGDEVAPAFLSVIGAATPSVTQRPLPERLAKHGVQPTSGRRRALAEWIASPQNPLTARVMVNRVWHLHFGRGIVPTTTDFGRAGLPPTNPDLLDWLAAEFIERGWSVKQLHRTIMLSETYRRSSRIANEKAIAADPGNENLWRQNLRRLEAEAIRDTVLAVSGRLNPEMGGRGFFPKLSGEVLAGSSRPGAGWGISEPRQRERRSVYMFIKRTLVVPGLDTFDYANVNQPLGERPMTTVAPQALMLLNDDFMQEQAAALANRLQREAGEDAAAQVRRAYELACSRQPTTRELALALDFLQRQEESFAAVRSRIVFRPDVPPSLHDGFMKSLRSDDFLRGPAHGWSYGCGFWSPAYEGIRSLDVARGPFALWEGTKFADGVVSAKITLQNASELAAVLLRAKTEGDVFHGYELLLDPRQGKVELNRHAVKVAVVAQADAGIVTEQPLPLRIELDGAKIRVWLGESSKAPLLDVADSEPITGAGQVGVRTWGSAVSLDDLLVRVGDKEVNVGLAQVDAMNEQQPDALPMKILPDESSRRALESFCLLVLNLNEMIYVD